MLLQTSLTVVGDEDDAILIHRPAVLRVDKTYIIQVTDINPTLL